MLAFLGTVLEDILADIVTIWILAIGIILFAYLRFSGIYFRLFNKIFPIKPDKRVLVEENIPLNFKPIINNNSPFQLPIHEYERDALVEFYRTLHDSKPHSGTVIRLDKLNPEIQVSKVGFFDLLATNMTVYPTNIRIVGLYNQLKGLFHWIFIYPLLHKITSTSLIGDYIPKTVDQILSNTNMANAVAVSVFIMDSSNNIAVVRRQKKLAVASGLFAATAAGTVSEKDLEYLDDPFINAAKRELWEETGLEVRLSLESIVISRQKMQPVFLYLGKIEEKWEDIYKNMQKARDYNKEISNIIKIDIRNPDEIVNFLIENELSNASAFHLWRLAIKENSKATMTKTWRKKFLSPSRLFKKTKFTMFP